MLRGDDSHYVNHKTWIFNVYLKCSFQCILHTDRVFPRGHLQSGWGYYFPQRGIQRGIHCRGWNSCICEGIEEENK